MMPTTTEPSPGPEGARAGFARRVFIVGCPRSGTTWVQLLLAHHPNVATCQETHIFSRYLGRLERGWRFERDGEAAGRPRGVGLSNVLDEEEFYVALRAFTEPVLERIREGKPNATTVVEKTPNHVDEWPLILRLYPDAWFLHVIRDPRSVVSSAFAATEWAGWATRSPVTEARRWRDAVSRGREIAGSTGRYLEVRYEDLAERGVDAVGRVYASLGLPHDRRLCEEAVAACRIGKLREASGGRGETRLPWAAEVEPEGFYRQGATEAWRQELSDAQVRVIEHVAGDLMETLGYRRVTPARKRRPLRLLARDALEWRLDAAYRRLKAWVTRL